MVMAAAGSPPAILAQGFLGDPALAPAIQILEAPPGCCGSPWAGELRGSVTNVDPTAVAVVLYAHTDLWYVQPYTDSQLVPDALGRFGSAVRNGASYA